MDDSTTLEADQESLKPIGQSTKPEFYKVPRRFDLAIVFVVTFVYAACFGMMNALGAPVAVTAALMGGLTLVGFVQMIVSERQARFAAIACGWVAMGAFYALQLSYLRTAPTPGMLLSGLFSTLIFGALTGYICGTVVAGVFLIADYIRRAIRAVRGDS